MKTYNDGAIDAIKMWGRVCGRQGNCAACPIGSVRGAGLSCQDFASQFPQKMLSILKEMDRDDVTYYQEYCMRFPETAMPLEVLSACICRKAIFEGYLDCEDIDNPDACIDCWKERYTGDITMYENSEIPTYGDFQYEDGMFEEQKPAEEDEEDEEDILSGVAIEDNPLQGLLDNGVLD